MTPTVSEPLRPDDDQVTRLRRCLRCDGTGRLAPRSRENCPECNGDGEVPDTSKWAGYSRILDYRSRRPA